jgi:hypothetical protein
LRISGFWHERSTAPSHQSAVGHPPQAPTPHTRFASKAVKKQYRHTAHAPNIRALTTAVSAIHTSK